MTNQAILGGRFTFPGTSLSVNRMGYGAMQLAGPHVFGPPRDPEDAVAVLKEALAAGVDHIDTSDFYGPHVTNQIIKRALHPYPKELVFVTKVGARGAETMRRGCPRNPPTSSDRRSKTISGTWAPMRSTS